VDNLSENNEESVLVDIATVQELILFLGADEKPNQDNNQQTASVFLQI
jgi:hypothetical protein